MDKIRIHPNDLISGAMYLKLIRDYKRYDEKQKEWIERLQKKLDFFEWENEDLRMALDEVENGRFTKLRDKITNQRLSLSAYHAQISQLKEENERLTVKLEQLSLLLEALNQRDFPEYACRSEINLPPL